MNITNTDKDGQYDQLLADVWLGVLLGLILLSFVFCLCFCLIFQKFQQWKRSGQFQEFLTVDRISFDCESLPSYTIASGLPSYDEALKQLEAIKIFKSPSSSALISLEQEK